jgi:NAD(P)H-dependent FMN reductase
MRIIYNDDFDNIVIASPVYMSLLTPPMSAALSRLQMYYAAKWVRKEPIWLKPKTGAIILTGGGNGSPDAAVKTAKLFLSILKAEITDENIVLSYDTDKTPAKDDICALNKISDIAVRLNGGKK